MAARGRRRIKIGLCASVAAAGVTVWLAQPALAIAKWSSPGDVFTANVTEISSDGTHRSRPALEVRSDAAGNVLAAWIQRVGSDCQAKWATRPVGGRWSRPNPLAMASCPLTSAGSQIALAMNTAGTAVVAYDDGLGVVAAVRPPGGSFDTPTAMDSIAVDPTVSINEHGMIAVGWVKPSFSFGSPTPFEAKIRPAGGSFGSVETVTATGSDTVISPRIAVGPGDDVVAVWVRSHAVDLSHTHLVVETAYRPAAGQFPSSPTQTLDDFAYRTGTGVAANYAPDLEFDAAGEATAVWVHDTGAKLYIQSAEKLVGSDTFQPEQDVNPTDSDNSFVPRVAVDPSTNLAIAVWLQCGASCAVRSAARPDGGIFGSLKTLASSLPTTAFAPVIGFTSSKTAIAAWSGPVGGASPDRVSIARRPKGGSFGSSQVISGPAGTGQDKAPSLGFDGHGNAIAVWAHLTATPSAQLRFSDFLSTYYQPDAMIKKAGTTTYTGTGIINASALHQSVTAKVKRGHSITFDIKVANPSSAADSFTVKGPGAKSGFGVQYLAGISGATDITSAVEHGTYTSARLAPGASKVFRCVVTVKAGTAVGASNNWIVVVSSKHDPARSDAVNAIVEVAS